MSKTTEFKNSKIVNEPGTTIVLVLPGQLFTCYRREDLICVSSRVLKRYNNYNYNDNILLRVTPKNKRYCTIEQLVSNSNLYNKKWFYLRHL